MGALTVWQCSDWCPVKVAPLPRVSPLTDGINVYADRDVISPGVLCDGTDLNSCSCPGTCLTLYLQFAGGMNGSESECESLDSGLETTSNSQLEAEGEGEGGHADPDTEEEERHDGGDTGDLSDFRCAVVSSTLSVLMRSVAFIISCLCQIPLFRHIELTYLLLSSLISMINDI